MPENDEGGRHYAHSPRVLKVCKKCNEELPIERFSRVGDGTERRRGSCKSCQAEYLKKHRRENPDYDWRSTKSPQARQRKADYAKRVRDLPDVRARKRERDRRRSAKARRSRESEHAERGEGRCTSCRGWVPLATLLGDKCIAHVPLSLRPQNQSPSARQRAELIRSNSQEFIGVHEYRKRCRRLGINAVVFPCTRSQIEAVYGDRCYYCGAEWSELDHYVPIKDGGSHSIDNLRPACATCNNAKRASMPTAWAASVVMIELKRRGIDLPPGVLESLRSLAA